MKCKHKWKVDPQFEGDGVIMLFGEIGNIKRERRYICEKCGEIDYK